jgi:hypothetical protein
MKLLIMQSSPASCNFLPPGSRYSVGNLTDGSNFRHAVVIVLCFIDMIHPSIAVLGVPNAFQGVN